MFRGAVKNDQRPLALSPTKSREGEIDGVLEAAKFPAARSPTCAIQTIFAAWPTSMSLMTHPTNNEIGVANRISSATPAPSLSRMWPSMRGRGK